MDARFVPYGTLPRIHTGIEFLLQYPYSVDKYFYYPPKNHRVSILVKDFAEYQYWDKIIHGVSILGGFVHKNPTVYGYQISRNLVCIHGAEYAYAASIYSGSNIYNTTVQYL
jgi:hypothetical protein